MKEENKEVTSTAPKTGGFSRGRFGATRTSKTSTTTATPETDSSPSATTSTRGSHPDRFVRIIINFYENIRLFKSNFQNLFENCDLHCNVFVSNNSWNITLHILYYLVLMHWVLCNENM